MVGGYAPERVALRRSISLGIDVGREISLIRKGQAIPAQAPMPPNTFGYDPAFVPVDDHSDRTMAELTPGEKAAISHRGRAARAGEVGVSGSR